jgi:hypothetical protein
MTDVNNDIPPCVLCGKPSIEAVPIHRGADGSRRTNVPLDVNCRQEWILEEQIVGWCTTGSHYGLRSSRCTVHGSLFVHPWR